MSSLESEDRRKKSMPLHEIKKLYIASKIMQKLVIKVSVKIKTLTINHKL